MICAIHQPNFLPYLGFFDKLLRSDVFILYDTAQYSRGDFHNRNRIKTPGGVKWLTVPVHLHFGQPIQDVRVAAANLARSHLGLLRQCYGKARWYEPLAAGIERAYQAASSGWLCDLTGRLLELVLDWLGYSGKVVWASSLNLDRSKRASDSLAEMVDRVGALTYLSGPGARSYLRDQPFRERGLAVAWQEFHHPVYDQPWGPFVPNLSILDALFNLGPWETARLLTWCSAAARPPVVA